MLANGNGQSIPALLRFHGVVGAEDAYWVQALVNGFLLVAIAAAAVLAFCSGRGDALFVVVGLSLVPASNIAWYHHYAFLILPLVVWMAASGLHGPTVAWVVAGMAMIQLDRWGLTCGLLAQAFILASIAVVVGTEGRRLWAAGRHRGPLRYRARSASTSRPPRSSST